MSLKATAIGDPCPSCGELVEQGTQHVCGTAPAPVVVVPAGDDPLIGSVVGERYRVISQISAGGMGVIYRAKHVLLENLVALKVLLRPQDPDAQRRFIQEAQIACKVQHPNTVYTSDFGVLPDGRYYIVMELLTGRTLADLIQKGRLSPPRACQIGLQIARGLAAVHDKGIIHRDLKPENVLLIEQDGKRDFVKIVDFGIATNTNQPLPAMKLGAEVDPNSPEAKRAFQLRYTLPGTVLGTPHYMSPEQALGEDVDARADQYALGCMLFEMLTGKVPFDDANAGALMFKHAYTAPPTLADMGAGPDVSPSLDGAVMRTLEKKRERRFATMRELESLLQLELDMLGNRSESMRMTGSAFQAMGVKPRPRWWLRTLLVAVLGLLGSGAWVYQAGYLRAWFPDTKALLTLREEAVASIVRDLQSDEAALRQEAIAILEATGDRSHAARIVPLLTDREASVRVRAAEALGVLDNALFTDQLAAVLDESNKNPLVAAAAAVALDQLGDGRGKKALKAAMTGKNDPAKIEAGLYLLQSGDKEASKSLLGMIEKGKVAEEGAVKILAKLLKSGDDGAKDSLYHRLSTGSKEQQAGVAVELSRAGDSRGKEVLRELLRRASPQQLRAATTLAELDEPIDADLFRAVIWDDAISVTIRLLALRGLSFTGGSGDLARLGRLLKGSTDAFLRQGVAATILRLCDNDAVLAAARSLGTGGEAGWLLRDQSVAALSEVDSDRSTSALARLLRKRDGKVAQRRVAAQVLGRRGGATAVRALAEGIGDPELEVRVAVTQALSKIAKRTSDKLASGAKAELSQALKQIAGQEESQTEIAARVALLALGEEDQQKFLLQIWKQTDVTKKRVVIEEVETDRELLVAGLADADPTCHRLAARKLALLQDARAVPTLQSVAGARPVTADGVLAGVLLQRLGQPANPELGPEKMATATDPTLRGAAVEAAALLDPMGLRGVLEQGSRDQVRSVREKALEAAQSLVERGTGLEVAQVCLRQLATDADAELRVRATVMFQHLKRTGKVIPDAPVSSGDKKPAVGEPDKRSGADGGVSGKSAESKGLDAGTPGTEPLSKALAQQRLLAAQTQVQRGEQPAARQALESLRAQCQQAAVGTCEAVWFPLASELSGLYEATRALPEAMSVLDKAEELSTLNRAQKKSLKKKRAELGKRLGRLVVKREVNGRCESNTQWVLPGAYPASSQPGETRTVQVGAGKSKTVGSCS